MAGTRAIFVVYCVLIVTGIVLAITAGATHQ